VVEEKGVKPEEITDIILTHAHHDHIECVKYFKNATVHIQSDEYEIGKDYLSQNPFIETFCDEKEIAKGVKVIKIGGHSKGSCVVECKKDGKTYVLCGDECYSFFNLKNKVPTATGISREKSLEFVEKYSSSDYVCLLCHQE
jgi:glyoxylase-like metal-dependent hydrolase (beta-lactamase superfamily II)